MATATHEKVNKTAFLTDFLGKNPKANSRAVNEAWTKSGNAGTVSPTLVSKLRSELGLSGNIRSRSKNAEPGGVAKASKAKPKAASTTTREVPGPSATIKPRSQGKGSFIKEVLFDNPLANAVAVNEAWRSSGMEGTISDSLVNTIRSELGLTGNLRKGASSGRAGGKARSSTSKTKSKTASHKTTGTDASQAARPSEKTGRADNRDRFLAAVEGEIDRLIFELMALGGMEKAEDALRFARRVVVRSHQA
jgi:hypothetical protein